MKHYVGLDVSMKKTSICIVNEQGKIVHESEVKTDPHALADAIEKTGLKIELIGFESGSLSHYLTRGFKERALPAVCMDARKMSAILSIQRCSITHDSTGYRPHHSPHLQSGDFRSYSISKFSSCWSLSWNDPNAIFVWRNT
jgi:hypothetical protein